VQKEQLQSIIKQQQLASNPANSAWVFASAGSGKTRILIDRLLRLLLSGVLPNKILCLTFTKAAASEMQNRIQENLSRWVKLSDDDLKMQISQLSGYQATNKDLQKARIIFFEIIDSDNKIKIMTIHSFCQSILKIFPFEAGISPNFEILEANSKKILIKKASDIVFKKISQNHLLKNDITNLFQDHSITEVSEAIEDLIKNKEDLDILCEKFFDINNIIKQIYKNCDISTTENSADILAEFKKQIIENKAPILQNYLNDSEIGKDKTIVKAINEFIKDSSLVNFHNYQSAFFNEKNISRKPSKNITKNEILQKIFDEQCNLIESFLDKINSLKICQNSSTILQLTNEILGKYNQLKQKDALLDYEDLIIITNKILQNENFASWIKMKMDSSYDHILVDESQDTNIKQWQIIKSLSEDFFSGIGASAKSRSLFVVGDEKQSIYSFQGAESDISNKIYNYYNNQSNHLKKINLNNSFRSSINVLKAVDDIFQNPQYGLAISKTNEYQSHNPIKNIKGNVEIWPQINNPEIEKNNKDFSWKSPSFEGSKELDAKEKLAKYIAYKIKFDIDSSKILEGSNHAVNFGDYMILLRNKTNNFDKILINYFRKLDIPFSSQSRLKFSESLAVQDLLAIAKFITTPFDNLNLAALLKSPIFNLNDDTLFKIINHNKKLNIIDNLANMKEYSEIYENLNDFSSLSKNLSSFNFYYKILNYQYFKNLYLKYYGAEFNEISNKFLSILENFCQNKSHQLQKLLEFINNADPEISLKSLDKNSVKILTIHSAKGLQAPIVFIPDCSFNGNRLKNATEIISWIDFDDNKLPIWCGRKSWQNNIIKNHSLDKIKKSKEEYLRLLYVAMTRAENELYIAGFGNDNDPQSWYQIIKNSLPRDNFQENIYKELDSKIEKIQQENITEKEKVSQNTNINHNFKNHLEKPIESNQDLDNLNFSQIRGMLLHEIIDFIIKNINSSTNWLEEKSKIIINRNNLLSQEERDIISQKISNFLASSFYKSLPSYKINSEIELAMNGKLYRVDLIIENQNQIHIIDYKSDQKITSIIPQKYQLQLQNYKKIIEKINPNKKVICSIFWLENMTLTQIRQ